MVFGVLRSSAVRAAKVSTLVFSAATVSGTTATMASANLIKPGVADPKKAKNIFAFNAIDIDGKEVDLER